MKIGVANNPKSEIGINKQMVFVLQLIMISCSDLLHIDKPESLNFNSIVLCEFVPN